MLSLGYIAFQNRQKGLEKPYHKDYRKIFFTAVIQYACKGRGMGEIYDHIRLAGKFRRL